MTKLKQNTPDMLQEAGQEVERKGPEKGFNLDKSIEELVGSICDPIIAWPSPWMDTIPKDLKDRVPLERMILQMRYHKGDIREMTATDVEALIYMYPRSLEDPMGETWTQIYIYLGAKVCGGMGREVPEELSGVVLTSYQEQHLEDLKRFIYDRRVKARKERARGERLDTKSKEPEEKEPPVIQHTFDLGLEK